MCVCVFVCECWGTTVGAPGSKLGLEEKSLNFSNISACINHYINSKLRNDKFGTFATNLGRSNNLTKALYVFWCKDMLETN